MDIGLDPATWDLPTLPTLIDGVELIRQRIRTRLLRGIGEWFINFEAGLPLLVWRQQKPPDVISISSAIQDEIVQIEGVVATQNFSGEFNPATRAVSIVGEVVTDGGEVSTVTVSGSSQPGPNSAIFAVFVGAGR